ncbi:MAG: Crp/Fnr family transcriptional regulator [Bacteroidota bacterium]
MADNQSFWYLENIDVTGIFCPNKLEDAMESHAHKKYKKGQYIYLPNEHADKIYFIASGSVKIGHYGDGEKEITKAILGVGEVFGELSLLGEDKRRDFVMAMEDSVVCILSKAEMNALMKNHSSLSLFMMKLMGSKLLEMEKRLESLVFKDSRTRIIEFLKNLADKKGQRVGYETLVRGFMTHQEIANLTATSRQTVTTVLNELRNKNVLTFNRRRLLIRDLDLLAKEGNLG